MACFNLVMCLLPCSLSSRQNRLSHIHYLLLTVYGQCCSTWLHPAGLACKWDTWQIEIAVKWIGVRWTIHLAFSWFTTLLKDAATHFPIVLCTNQPTELRLKALVQIFHFVLFFSGVRWNVMYFVVQFSFFSSDHFGTHKKSFLNDTCSTQILYVIISSTYLSRCRLTFNYW